MTSQIDLASSTEAENEGIPIFALAEQLWPLNRSISGKGLRKTLMILRDKLPGLKLLEIESGRRVLDWVVPDEWQIHSGWIDDLDGQRLLDLKDNNLHVIGYSEGIDAVLPLEELQAHLYSIPEQPTAIPYVTSYYARRWGFCLSDQQRLSLTPGSYHVHIDAKHFPGSITLGELILPGRSQKEILLSSYCCHPSMANNELSGPCLLTQLALWLDSLPNRRWTYRILFLPEIIGSAAYLHDHYQGMKKRTIAGFNITCVGDERGWSYLPSRSGNTLSDVVARHVLNHEAPGYRYYSWLDRGSDESNYCAPGIDLPIASVMRTKYGEYPEYHTSLDTLGNVVTAKGLGESFLCYRSILSILERHCTPISCVLGEPQLGARGLYPSLSRKGSAASSRTLLDLLSYADGQHSLLSIADQCRIHVRELFDPLDTLLTHGLIRLSEEENF